MRVEGKHEVLFTLRPSSKSVVGSGFCVWMVTLLNPPHRDKSLLEKCFQQLITCKPVVGENREILHIDLSTVIQIRGIEPGKKLKTRV